MPGAAPGARRSGAGQRGRRGARRGRQVALLPSGGAARGAAGPLSARCRRFPGAAWYRERAGAPRDFSLFLYSFIYLLVRPRAFPPSFALAARRPLGPHRSRPRRSLRPPRSGAGRGGSGGAGRAAIGGGAAARPAPLAMPMPARPCGRYSTGMARPGGMAGVPVGALLPLLVGVCGAVTGSRVYPANEGEARPPRAPRAAGKFGAGAGRRSLRPAAPRAARSRPVLRAGAEQVRGAERGAATPAPPAEAAASRGSPGAAPGGCPGCERGTGRDGTGQGRLRRERHRPWVLGAGSTPPSVRGAACSLSGAPLAAPSAPRAAPASGAAPRYLTWAPRSEPRVELPGSPRAGALGCAVSASAAGA